MVQRKRFQTFSLACLIALMTLSPAVTGLAATAWTKSNGVYVSSDGTAIAGVVARGIDVAQQTNAIDWNAVARDDVQFVMLGTRSGNTANTYFKTSADSAAAAGLKVGAYLYSYATTTDMAAAEADFVLNLIKDSPISYPVVFSVEASAMSALTPSQLSEIINTFCKRIKDAGYYPMLYANDYWLSEKIDRSKVKYDVWVARYEAMPSYSGAAMWQATNTGTVNGISGNVDINFAYKDYSALIPSNIWREINGNWYYYSDYTMQTGWINDGNGWYYMKEDGTQHKGWLHIGNDYFYLNDDTGKMVTGWRQDPSNSKWYYFNANGTMATGWVDDGGKRYYLMDDGTMVTEWLRMGNDTYYYLLNDGAMATGWQQMDGAWYYFNPTGELLRGWSDIEGARYFIGTDGKMFTGWQQIDNQWYYFGTDGAMRTGWQLLDSIWYYLNEQGQMLTGWQQINGKYYYLHQGQMLTGWVSDSNGNKYYMDATDGDMSIAWKEIEGSWYYFNQYGHMQTGWLNLSGKYYYLDPATGKMEANGSRLIDNVNYTFDQDGVLQNETNQMSGAAANTVSSAPAGNSAGSSSSVLTGSSISVGSSVPAGNSADTSNSVPPGNSAGTQVLPPGSSSTSGTTVSGNLGNSGDSTPSGNSGSDTPPGGSGNGQTSGFNMAAPGLTGSSGSSSYSNHELEAGLTGGPGR